MILKIICGLIYCPILGLRIGPPPITPCNLVLFTDSLRTFLPPGISLNLIIKQTGSLQLPQCQPGRFIITLIASDSQNLKFLTYCLLFKQTVDSLQDSLYDDQPYRIK